MKNHENNCKKTKNKDIEVKQRVLAKKPPNNYEQITSNLAIGDINTDSNNDNETDSIFLRPIGGTLCKYGCGEFILNCDTTSHEKNCEKLFQNNNNTNKRKNDDKNDDNENKQKKQKL